MAEIVSNSVLPARRDIVHFTTTDGVRIVGELALPLRPVRRTIVCLHPNPLQEGSMDSHVLRKLAWRFHTVPRDPKLGPQDHPDLDEAVKTWDPDSRWDVGGGGTPWDAINYDPETGLVIIGTGNGGPYHTARRSPKGGDQLYLSSLVALDAKTGRVKWHYQEVPGDNWDYTATAPMILTRMTIGGEDRPVVLHAPKNGFLYILDRRDGRLLSAKAIVHQNWTKGIDPKTGRPIPNPEAADYASGPKIVFPATPGARNWHPGAYDPASGLYVAPVQDMGNLLFMTPGVKPKQAKMLNNDAALLFGPVIEPSLPGLPPALADAVRKLPAMAEVRRLPWSSELRAIEPLSGRTVWSVPPEVMSRFSPSSSVPSRRSRSRRHPAVTR